MLFVINSQLGRRNIADVDRIMLVSKREEILRRQAKANQSAAGKQTSLGKRFADVVLALAPKAAKPIDCRKQLAAEAGVGEHTYSDGKAILDAVADGELLPQIVEDIRNSNDSIHGVAKSLKVKPVRKAKRPAGKRSSDATLLPFPPRLESVQLLAGVREKHQQRVHLFVREPIGWVRRMPRFVPSVADIVGNLPNHFASLLGLPLCRKL